MYSGIDFNSSSPPNSVAATNLSTNPGQFSNPATPYVELTGDEPYVLIILEESRLVTAVSLLGEYGNTASEIKVFVLSEDDYNSSYKPTSTGTECTLYGGITISSGGDVICYIEGTAVLLKKTFTGSSITLKMLEVAVYTSSRCDQAVTSWTISRDGE